MKPRVLFSFLCIAFAGTLFAQAPEGFNYQAVVRDNNGDPIANAVVSFRLDVHQTTATGTVVYRETHAASTNATGIANLVVGAGTPVIGTFNTIDWGADTYFLEVWLDPAGGSSYTSMGTQQLLSVPYALHAATVEDKDDADADPTNELVTEFYLDGDSLLLSDGGGTRKVVFSGLSSDADTDPTNELNAALALDGDSLVLTDGGGNLKVDLSALRQIPYGSSITSTTCAPQPDDLSAKYEPASWAELNTANYWQSFTVHSTGDLSTVSWLGVNSVISSGNLRIYKGEGVNGSLLEAQALGASVAGWNMITLTDPVPVMADSVYTMLIYAPANFHWAIDLAGGYPEGTAQFGTGSDLAFRTTVTSICGDSTINVIQTNPGGSLQLNQVDTIHFSDGSFQTTAPIGDDLGDHTATQALDLAGNDIVAADSVTAAAFIGDGAMLTNVPGDDLGDHTATQTLDLAGHNITNGNVIYAEAFSGDGQLLTNVPGDDLGDHTATQPLDLSGNDINNADTVTATTFIGSGAMLTDVPGDDLGNHAATQNVKLNGHYLSGDGGNEGVFVNSSGQVGIGKSNPGSKLDVAGDARFVGNDPKLMFLDTAGTNGTRQSTITTTMLSALGSDSPASQHMSFNVSNNSNTGTTEAMTLRGDGKVGVGTSSPTETLDVNGTVRIRGGSPAAGSVLMATGTDGTATWSSPQVGYSKVSVSSTYSANSGWKLATAVVPLSVNSGDRLLIQAQAVSYLSSGSGIDDFQYRVQITGCASATTSVVTYRPPSDVTDHTMQMPVSYLDVWSATCTGNVYLQLEVQNTGDDSWNIMNRLMVVTNVH